MSDRRPAVSMPSRTSLEPMPGRGEAPAVSPARTLDEAVAELIHGGGSIIALAVASGYPAKRLYHWGTTSENASADHRDIPLKAAIALTKLSGRRVVLDWFADSCGCVAVPLPGPTRTVSTLLDRVATLTADFADVQQTVAAALDGMTPAEARALDKELLDLVRAGEALRRGLRQEGAA